MKKLTIFILIGLAFQAAVGQNTFSLQLVGSGGGQTDNPTYQTSWSVGEPVTATSSAGSYTITQGFQQAPSCVNPTSGGTIASSQTICYNTAPAAFTNEAAASGQVGTLEYRWQKSVISGSSGFSDIASSNSATYAPGSLSVTTWYRRLARVDCAIDWSGGVTSDVLQVTVLDDLLAPVMGNSQNIFYNTIPETLNVTTPATGGSGTFAYQWQKNDGSGWTNVGTGGLTYAPPALTISTDYRVIATDNGSYLCGSVPGNSITIDVYQGHTIRGTLSYYKNGATNLPMNNVELWLMDGTTKLAGYTTDNGTGYFEFTHVNDGDHSIAVHNNGKPVGGINATDAALSNWWSTHFTDIEPVKFLAGDVQDYYWLQSTDAYMIQQYFVYGTPFTRTIATGTPWTYWQASGNIIHSNSSPYNGPTEWPDDIVVNVPHADVAFDLLALCTGDFNGSFTPGGLKNEGATVRITDGATQQVAPSAEITLPIRTNSACRLGALSLILNFPSDLAEIKDVIMTGSSDLLDWTVNGNELRIGWNSRNPLTFAAGDAVVNLRLTTASSFTAGHVIRFSLASDPLNELADNCYNVIPDAVLNTDVIEASAIGINDQPVSADLSLTNQPNPFDARTTISYSLPADGQVTLTVCNMVGQDVKALVNEFETRGLHSLRLEAWSLEPGVYTATLKLKTADGQMVKTIKLVKTK